MIRKTYFNICTVTLLLFFTTSAGADLILAGWWADRPVV